MADLPLDSFNSVVSNVPKWLSDLENLLKTTQERQAQVVADEDATNSVPSIRTTRSKSSSLFSRHSSRKGNTDTATAAAPDTSRITLPPTVRPVDTPVVTQRKRKSASVLSGESGPTRLRAKPAFTIYYDGEVQKTFEKLVRAVGVTRNAIRKGKMAAKVDQLSRTESMSSESGLSGDEAADSNKMTYKVDGSRRSRSRSGLFGRNDNTAAFDRVDGFLEKGQIVCEKAAHQLLREGDCAPELSSATAQFSDAKKTAEAELPALMKKAEKAADRRRRSEERQREADENESKSTTREMKFTSPFPVAAAPLSHDTPLEIDLSAEESDDGGAELIVKSMQLSKYRTRRSPLPTMPTAGY